MKIATIFLVLVSFSCSTQAFADAQGLKVTYKLSMNMGQSEYNGEGVYYFAPGLARVEMANPVSGKSVMISTETPKQSFVYFPDQSTYMEMDMKSLPAGISDRKDETPFSKTGKRKKVAGYECEIMMREMNGQKEEACVSNTLKKFHDFLKNSSFVNAGQGMAMPKGIDGFPLEMAAYEPKGKERIYSMVVSEIKEQNLKSNLFEVPSGYKKIDSPKMSPEAMQGMKEQLSDEQKAKLDEAMEMLQKHLETPQDVP